MRPPFDDDVHVGLVELGREVRCGVVETADGLLCLPLEEYAVDAATKPVRDHADKLARDSFIWSHLAGDSVQRLKVAQRLAKMAATGH